jgi:GNAT superfamily N-acetyltransferase
MAVEVRRAVTDDSGLLLDLIHAHAEFERNDAPISLAALQALLAAPDPPTTIFVVAEGNGPIAYAAVTMDYSLWRASYWVHLDCLFVSSSRRSRRIGAQLLQHIVLWSKDRGADRLEWQTPVWNEEAIRFYEREGAACAIKNRFWIGLCRPA